MTTARPTNAERVTEIVLEWFKHSDSPACEELIPNLTALLDTVAREEREETIAECRDEIDAYVDESITAKDFMGQNIGILIRSRLRDLPTYRARAAGKVGG